MLIKCQRRKGQTQKNFEVAMHELHCSGDLGALESVWAFTVANVAFLTWRKSSLLCLQQPSQPIVHARAILASKGSFLYFSWYASALSSQKVSLVKASGASLHSHSSFSIASFKFWHIVLHHSSQHSVQVPDVQYMISYFFSSLSLHLGSSPRAKGSNIPTTRWKKLAIPTGDISSLT